MINPEAEIEFMIRQMMINEQFKHLREVGPQFIKAQFAAYDAYNHHVDYYMCPTCMKVSYNKNDIENKYCNNCKTFQQDQH